MQASTAVCQTVSCYIPTASLSYILSDPRYVFATSLGRVLKAFCMATPTRSVQRRDRCLRTHAVGPIKSATSLEKIPQQHPLFQVTCLALSKCGRWLASGQQTYLGFKADIIIWDLEHATKLHTLTLHKVQTCCRCTNSWPG